MWETLDDNTFRVSAVLFLLLKVRQDDQGLKSPKKTMKSAKKKNRQKFGFYFLVVFVFLTIQKSIEDIITI